MVEVHVNGIFITQSKASGVILKEEDGERALPIVIGEYEAQSIAMALENFNPPRPITHDLAVNILKTLHIKIDSILISDLKDNTYYALISLNKDGEVFEVDARPSDAIALAVRLGTTIFVNDSVMDEAGYIPDGSEKDLQDLKIESDEDDLELLKQKLKKAVEDEDYEKAAALRDEIKRIEHGFDK